MGFDKHLFACVLHYNDSTIQNTPTETVIFNIYLSKHYTSIFA